MSYKDIIKQIEHYEKKCNEAYMIYGDHGQTEHKKMLYIEAKNKMTAALLALYDFCEIYRYGENDPDVKKLLENYNQNKEPLKISLGRTVNDDKMNEECTKIYNNILDAALTLRGKNYLKLIKYGEEKKRKHDRRRQRELKEQNKKIVNKLVEEVVYNYKKYCRDKQSRKEDFHHVGTSIEEIKAYEEKITKEEVKYNLLYKAIMDALQSSSKNVAINKELVMYCFEKANCFPLEKERYFDEDAYELSQNGYDIYGETFKDTYGLSKEYQKKLNKKIDNKLNLKEQ